MAEPTLPILYSFRRCPYAMRARLALLSSGQQFELREVDLKNKPPEMLAASPKGTVPVLVFPDGTVIDQSMEIMLWALAGNDPLDWLARETDMGEQTHSLVRECDGKFKAQLDRYKYPGRFEGADSLEARESGATFLRALDVRLRSAKHLIALRTTVADAAIMPFVRQYAAVDPAWFAAQEWDALKDWLGHWTASDLFTRIMARYPAWKVGTAPVTFPPQAP